MAADSTDSSKRIWRESSYNFGKDSLKRNSGPESREVQAFDFMQRGLSTEDPASKLIGQFMHMQKATAAEISLDMESEMGEPQHEAAGNNGNNYDSSVNNSFGTKTTTHALPTVSEPPNTNFSPFQSLKRRYSKSTDYSFNRDTPPRKVSYEGDVVKCSSNKSFDRKRSNLMMTKSRSRLMDSQPEPKSGKGVGRSEQLRSGFVGKNVDEEEEDLLVEEDLPKEYKKENIGIWVLVEWFILILIFGALICSLTIHRLERKRIWKLKLWRWEVMVLVLICGRLVSSWLIRIIVFCIERNFLLRKRVLYFVYGVRKAVQNCLWLGLVLIAWHYLFNDHVQQETDSKVLKYLTKVLICIVVSLIFWLVKTLLVKVLGSSFHVSTYFDRIQEALFNQYIITTLSGPPLIEIQKAHDEEEMISSEILRLQNAGAIFHPDLKASILPSQMSPRVMAGIGRFRKPPLGGKSPRLSGASSDKADEGITIDHLHRLNPKNVSAWNMKRLMNIIRHGSLTTVDEEQMQDATPEDESAPHIQSECEAKASARKIFQNVAKPGSKFIYLEDVARFLDEDEALKIMGLFDEACESSKISKSALKNWVVNIFRERRALTFTLSDTKTAINKLHRFVNILLAIIVVVVWLIILGIATTKFLLFISSQFVLVAFIFGNTCKALFEAVIFLFVVHPFDVGDRCEIDEVQMVVEEMNILTTIFLRYDNVKVTIPNSLLATKAISNYYRSPEMGDGVEFCVHIATPAEKIAQMRQRILSYIENKKDHWCPNPMIIFKDVEDLNKVRIAIWLSHRINHQDMGERWARRALLVEELAMICRELDLQYRLLPVDINVRAMPGNLMTPSRAV